MRLAPAEIAGLRLDNQQIVRTNLHTPAEIVSSLGAVQAQDYAGAKWALGLRLPRSTDAGIEQALADRTIVRTWPMRGTLHFVAAADLRWMLELLTPRIAARSASRRKQLELDDATFARSRKLFTKALSGGKQRSRSSMYQLLETAGISPGGERGIHILRKLAEDQVLCFGAREGKQETFALLDEWIAPARPLHRDDALAELARRYFTSHGPATLHDFAWWSGLTIGDAKAAIEMVRSRFVEATVDGQAYWFADAAPPAKIRRPRAHLLPPFDEYLVGYKDRSAVLDPAHKHRIGAMLSPTIMIDGRIAGTWGRTFTKDTAVLTRQPFAALTDAEDAAVMNAIARYAAFLGRRPLTQARIPLALTAESRTRADLRSRALALLGRGRARRAR